jgi:hypothetical protein
MESAWEDTVPIPLEALGGQDLTELEIKLVETKRQKKLGASADAEEGGEEEEGEEEEVVEDEANEEEAAPEGETKEEEGPAVHEGVSCDMCGTGPITGNRYKCAK